MTCHKKHNVTRPKCQKIWNVATYKMSKNMKCQEIQKNYVTNYKMSKNMICYKTWVVKKYETDIPTLPCGFRMFQGEDKNIFYYKRKYNGEYCRRKWDGK